MACLRFPGLGILTYTPDFKPGDPPPDGYNDWHAWAEVQAKAGLKQEQCCGCSRWFFPQELSGKVREFEAYRTKRDAMAGGKKGKVKYKLPVCIECDKKEAKR